MRERRSFSACAQGMRRPSRSSRRTASSPSPETRSLGSRSRPTTGTTFCIDEANGVFTDTEATTLAGGYDDDDLLGGAGVETFLGGPDDDSVDGNQGADVALLGSGDDSFTWDPGDGSDMVEGSRARHARLQRRRRSEIFDASANGQRLRFFRNLGNIVMDVDGTERVDLRALGGADHHRDERPVEDGRRGVRHRPRHHRGDHRRRSRRTR